MNFVEIGSLIRQRRRQLKLSQTELGRLAGISRPTLSGLENGTIDEVGLRRVIAVCAHLGLAIEVAPTKPKRPTLDDLVDEQRKLRDARLTSFVKG